jgi:hypothetical protein
MVEVLTYKHPPVQLLPIEVYADQMEQKAGGGNRLFRKSRKCFIS